MEPTTQHLTMLESVNLIRLAQTRPDLQFLFRHALIQDAAYESLLLDDRKQLHRQVAETLERLYPDRLDELASLLGQHFSKAGEVEKAVSYLQKAGEQAVNSSANQEAIDYFNGAINLLKGLPNTPKHNEQELMLQIALFAPLAAAKGYAAPEVGQAFLRARQLCEQVDAPDQLFLVLYGLWGHNLVLGDMKIARELSMQCLTLAEMAQERALLMEGHRITDETAFYRGEFVSARKHLEQSLPLYDPQLHRAHATVYGQDPGVALLSHGAWILWHLGFPDQALKMGQEAISLGEDSSHPFSLGFALCYAAVAHQLCQEEQRVEELVETAINLSTKQGFVLWLAIATVLQGWVLAKQGQAEEGIAQMRHGLADYKALSVNLSRPYLLALLAETYGDVGQPAEGLTLLAEAMNIVEKGELRHYEADLHRLEGELLLMQGESPESVEASYRQAVKAARQQEAKSLELRAVISLSRLLQQQGQRSKAHQMLAEIYGWFTEGFDTADLKEAKALLEELS